LIRCDVSTPDQGFDEEQEHGTEDRKSG
jgi:hypothetical protein